jgi:hypothetical protein
MDIWARVLDLPMDMMNRVYGELFGNWIGKYIAADVDDEGMAWGEDLRIHVAVRVDQPLVRGVCVRESEKEKGRWFDLKYEKVPHFCFDCGRLVHSEGRCSAEGEKVKQWGEWLRAEPRKQKKSHATPSRQSFSSGSFGSKSGWTESLFRETGAYVRDIPPRRNYHRDFFLLWFFPHWWV